MVNANPSLLSLPTTKSATLLEPLISLLIFTVVHVVLSLSFYSMFGIFELHFVLSL